LKKASRFIGVLIELVVGGIGGYVGTTIIANAIPGETIWISILGIGIAIIALVIGAILHIIIHEAGHLIMGRLSGYSFVSFRIFNITFIKGNGKLMIKKFNIAGTAGQALMSPPDFVEGAFPSALYNFGGSIMNFIFSAIFLGMYFIFSQTFVIGSAIFFIIAITGIGIGLANIIPLKIDGLANDGYNALMLGKKKNEVTRYAWWVILKVNALLTQGYRYRDMPPEWFEVIDNDNLSDPIIAAAVIEKYNYLVDKNEMQEGRVFIENILNKADQMFEIHKNQLRCELLFQELTGERRKEEINRLYTKDLKEYLECTALYPSSQRLLYAYARLVLNDDKEAEKRLQMFEQVCLTTPLLGGVESERETIQIIDRMRSQRNE